MDARPQARARRFSTCRALLTHSPPVHGPIPAVLTMVFVHSLGCPNIPVQLAGHARRLQSCNDAVGTSTGYNFGPGRPATCAMLQPYCNHGSHGAGIRATCPITCSVSMCTISPSPPSPSPPNYAPRSPPGCSEQCVFSNDGECDECDGDD